MQTEGNSSQKAFPRLSQALYYQRVLEPSFPQGPDEFELIIILCILPLFTCRLNARQSKLFTEFPQKVSSKREYLMFVR